MTGLQIKNGEKDETGNEFEITLSIYILVLFQEYCFMITILFHDDINIKYLQKPRGPRIEAVFLHYTSTSNMYANHYPDTQICDDNNFCNILTTYYAHICRSSGLLAACPA